MIPLTLQIKNFLSYGEPIQTIEFGNYSLICLSGKNGHGKSALLDAITWALWGQARKIGGTAKADQGLLRLGQTQMMVCFDFEVGGNRYRVKREYMQTYGKPVALLEFGMLESESHKFIPLTEKTLRDTQAKIDQTLHLSFDGFTNSAFLRQGQANEFSKKSPKERKEVLSTILGLDQYENIRRLANEKVKQSNTHKVYLNTLLTKLDQELAQATSLDEKTKMLELQEKELFANEHQLNEKQKQYEIDKKALEKTRQEQALLLFEYKKQNEDQEKYKNQLRQLIIQWRSIHKQQLSQRDYKDLEQQKQLLVSEIAQHQIKLQEYLNLQQDILRTRELFNTVVQTFQQKKSADINKHILAIERLQAQITHQQTTIADSLARKQKAEETRVQLAQEHSILIAQIPQDVSPLIATVEKQFERRKEHYQRWITIANLLNTELAANSKKNSLVINEESPSCPLCEQNLSAARKRFLKKKFEIDITYIQHRFTRLSTVIKKLKLLLVEQHTQLEQLKKQQQTYALLQQTEQELTKKCNAIEIEIAEFTAQITKQQELHTIVLQTIESEQQLLLKAQSTFEQELLLLPEYKQTHALLTQLETQLSSQTYNKEAHQTANTQLQLVEEQLKQYQTLQEQAIMQAERKNQIQDLCNVLRTLKQNQKLLAQKIIPDYVLDAQENALNLVAQEMAKNRQNIRLIHEQLLQEKGSIERQHQQLQQYKKEQIEYQKQLAECNNVIDDYQVIMQATGKDGIQALLIEDAIPEIEQEANQLLSKLTENQTQLFIDSLRDLKKGGTKETLDIKISDSVGIRPYELFSGGEAFRIDFALRIAISKLLARRAGTSLQTLIIDEGFGSQDDEGLNNIMDALYKIQDDFAKIIIVSHLNSMKNQFPVHFVIEKGPQGSQVQVIEQG